MDDRFLKRVSHLHTHCKVRFIHSLIHGHSYCYIYTHDELLHWTHDLLNAFVFILFICCTDPVCAVTRVKCGQLWGALKMATHISPLIILPCLSSTPFIHRNFTFPFHTYFVLEER